MKDDSEIPEKGKDKVISSVRPRDFIKAQCQEKMQLRNSDDPLFQGLAGGADKGKSIKWEEKTVRGGVTRGSRIDTGSEKKEQEDMGQIILKVTLEKVFIINWGSQILEGMVKVNNLTSEQLLPSKRQP